MKFKAIIPLSLLCLSLGLVGCGSSKTADLGNSNDPLANQINGIFGGYGTDGLNNNSQNSINNNSKPGYRYNYGTNNNNYNNKTSMQKNNINNNKFGYGMNGAENILGNKKSSKFYGKTTNYLDTGNNIGFSNNALDNRSLMS